MIERFERPVTPADLSPGLVALIGEVAPGQVPIYVDAIPTEGAPPDECFGLVDRQVACYGGVAVLGWALWEFPTLFVEAEFHCVWRAPGGRLIDVAPKKSPTTRILFVLDEQRRYEGHSVNNMRRPLRKDPAVAEYLSTFEDLFMLMNRGARAGQHGEISLVGDEALEFHAIQSRQAALGTYVMGLAPVVGPYLPCPCGSGKKLKWCCGG